MSHTQPAPGNAAADEAQQQQKWSLTDATFAFAEVLHDHAPPDGADLKPQLYQEDQCMSQLHFGKNFCPRAEWFKAKASETKGKGANLIVKLCKKRSTAGNCVQF